jgi:hypothetical protein
MSVSKSVAELNDEAWQTLRYRACDSVAAYSTVQ